MTGRELIIYIMENHLEDELVVKDGKIIGFVTPDEIATKMSVGVATVYVWLWQKRLPAVRIGDRFYIPANYKPPMERI